MTTLRFPTAAAAAALMLAAPLALSAQQPAAVPPGGTVPLELVQALVPSFPPMEGGTPEILIGSLPPAMAEAIPLPPGTRVLGSVVYAGSSRAVLELPEPRGEAFLQLEAQLRSRGWTEPATAPAFERAGFQADLPTVPSYLCSPDGAAMNLLPGGLRREGTDGPIQIWHYENPRLTPCNVEGLRQRHPAQNIPIPALAPPAGVAIQGAGSGGAGGFWESRARARFAGTPEALATLYSEQLRAAGWAEGSRSAGADHAIQVWRFRDAEDRPWNAILVALQVQAGVHDLYLRMMRPDLP